MTIPFSPTISIKAVSCSPGSVSTLLQATLLLTLLFGSGTGAQAAPDFGSRGDLTWGFASFKHPDAREVGSRTLSVLVQSSRLDQETPFSSLPASGKLRVELQYKSKREAWQSNPSRAHSLLPRIDRDATGAASSRSVNKLIAVLPQAGRLSRSRSARLPRQLTARFNRNPVKFRPGEPVEYRWVIVNDKGLLHRPNWHVGKFLMPGPFSVALMGDSFGAGEGAPKAYKPTMERPASLDHVAHLAASPVPSEADFGDFAVWSDRTRGRQAHRSKRSGLTLGLGKFKRENPDVWVESIHTATSSATVRPWVAGEDEPKADGMYTPFVGKRELFVDVLGVANVLDFAVSEDFGIIDPQDNLQEAQLAQVERWLGKQKLSCIDAAVVSAGGNDTGFGAIIVKALGRSLKHNEAVVSSNVENGLDLADSHVEQFFEELGDYAPPRVVHWSTYPNLTRANRDSHSSLTLHRQTVFLGGEIVLAGIAGRIIGGFIGALSSPLPIITPDDIAAMALVTAGILKERNLNPWVLGITAGISTDDLTVAEQLLVTQINPRISKWCKAHGDIDCKVIDEIQDNAIANGIAAGDERSVRDDQRSSRWFNTFIDSSRYACGGLDCAVHPTIQGYQRIYEEAVYQRIQDSYADSVKKPRNCSPLPPLTKLVNEWNEREQLALRIARGNPPKNTPLKPGIPEEEKKEMYEFFRQIHGNDKRGANEAIAAYNRSIVSGRMGL